MSLIVSSCVQVIQKCTSWRQKNLILGLHAIGSYCVDLIDTHDSNKVVNKPDLKNEVNIALLRLLQPALKTKFRVCSFERSEVSFLEVQQAIEIVLLRHIECTASVKRELFDTLAAYFSRIEVEMRFRFRRLTHISALICSSLLVLSLQLNTITLMEKGIAVSVSDHEQFSKSIQNSCLSTKTTEQQLSCLSHTLIKAEIVSLSVWPHGMEYFIPHQNNQFDWFTFLNRMFGLICSIILISLGAPFWFERLKSIFVLKEAVKVKV